jgi:hypothetical protein
LKITGIETYPVWGGHRNFLFVVVDTDEGIYGVGEAGITGRELAVTGAIEHFRPLLIGQDPMRTEHIWQLLFRLSPFEPGLSQLWRSRAATPYRHYTDQRRARTARMEGWLSVAARASRAGHHVRS